MNNEVIKFINQTRELKINDLKEVFTNANLTTKGSMLFEIKNFANFLAEAIQFAENHIIESYAKKDVNGNLMSTSIIDENTGESIDLYIFEEKKKNAKLDDKALLESLEASHSKEIAESMIYDISIKPKSLTELNKPSSGIPKDLLDKCTIKGEKTGEIVIKQIKLK